MESTLKVAEVKACKNTQFFINKFHFGGFPPCMCSHRNIYMNIYNSIIYNTPKWKQLNYPTMAVWINKI